ncbi:hypothetical protein [Pseudoalteromonas sp. L1]|uniref:hypothetical protein n=1 Tax=Pseudoalteromonas sp. L1 TaxID=195716 RepID=UPI001F1F4932|nr:hypothetical protein [Pseudoalteromonas sp. L1]
MQAAIAVLRSKNSFPTPEIKYFVVHLCFLISESGGSYQFTSERELARDMNTSLRSVQDSVRYLSEEGLIELDEYFNREIGVTTNIQFTQKFNELFAEYLDHIPSRSIYALENLFSSQQFLTLSKRSAVKLYLLTLIVHSDEFGVTQNLSITDLTQLLGRFSKDRLHSQLAILKKAGYIIDYSPGRSSKILFGKVKSQYLLEQSQFRRRKESNRESKTSVVLIVQFNHPAHVFNKLARLASIIARTESFADVESKKLASLVEELYESSKRKFSKCTIFQILKLTEELWNTEMKANQLQAYASRIALDVLTDSCWTQPTIEQVQSKLIIEELFSEQFLKQLVHETFCFEDNVKLKTSPLKEQPEIFCKLKAKMESVFNAGFTEDKVISQDKLKHARVLMQLILISCMYTASRYLKLLPEAKKNEKVARFFFGQEYFTIRLQ